VIRSAWPLRFTRGAIRAAIASGEIFFNREISGHDVFGRLPTATFTSRPFTVREGETILDIAMTWKSKTDDRRRFLGRRAKSELIRDIAPRAKTLEGFLFPATYSLHGFQLQQM